MTYHVLPLTAREILEGELYRILSLAELALRYALQIRHQQERVPQHHCDIEVFLVDPFVDAEAFERIRHLCPGSEPETILLFNECAVEACELLEVLVKPVARIEDADLPEGRSLFLRVPLWE